MRALVSAFLSFSFLLAACGGGPSAQQEPAKAPVVEVGSGPEAPPLPAQGSEEDGATEPREAKAVESVDACIERMRAGLGLSERVKASPEGAKYAEALAAERASDSDGARKGYLQLIQQSPASDYVPLVYFAFGELFLREADKDPSKLALAEQSYFRAAQYPSESTVHLAANFRMAEIERRTGRHTQALYSLGKIAGTIAKHPDAPCAAAFAAPVRANVVAVYAEVGRPSTAFAFFRKVGGDEGEERTHALAMVAALAELYVQQQKHDDAATALLSANASFRDTAYCRREDQLVTKLGPSLAATRRDELAHAHSLHCVPR
ncbi:hypothetical protein [Polyangium sp. 15x6]|uniref:tetratricopeptide repeat protein n=1 Tax=Polyangium sp. 15x6 TaxID=3042687 RepID=UPI00249C5E36|nr:hypothetical protein [Polyangium sp. 15x6]MDI3285014.1 hypothetical protein [Polyangium sp. 15x6]